MPCLAFVKYAFPTMAPEESTTKISKREKKFIFCSSRVQIQTELTCFSRKYEGFWDRSKRIEKSREFLCRRNKFSGTGRQRNGGGGESERRGYWWGKGMKDLLAV
jgi:hypothetical protein